MLNPKLEKMRSKIIVEKKNYLYETSKLFGWIVYKITVINNSAHKPAAEEV